LLTVACCALCCPVYIFLVLLRSLKTGNIGLGKHIPWWNPICWEHLPERNGVAVKRYNQNISIVNAQLPPTFSVTVSFPVTQRLLHTMQPPRNRTLLYCTVVSFRTHFYPKLGTWGPLPTKPEASSGSTTLLCAHRRPIFSRHLTMHLNWSTEKKKKRKVQKWQAEAEWIDFSMSAGKKTRSAPQCASAPPAVCTRSLIKNGTRGPSVCFFIYAWCALVWNGHYPDCRWSSFSGINNMGYIGYIACRHSHCTVLHCTVHTYHLSLYFIITCCCYYLLFIYCGSVCVW